MDFKEARCEDVRWIQLVVDMVQWRVLVNMTECNEPSEHIKDDNFD